MVNLVVLVGFAYLGNLAGVTISALMTVIWLWIASRRLVTKSEQVLINLNGLSDEDIEAVISVLQTMPGTTQIHASYVKGDKHG